MTAGWKWVEIGAQFATIVTALAIDPRSRGEAPRHRRLISAALLEPNGPI